MQDASASERPPVGPDLKGRAEAPTSGESGPGMAGTRTTAPPRSFVTAGTRRSGGLLRSAGQSPGAGAAVDTGGSNPEQFDSAPNPHVPRLGDRPLGVLATSRTASRVGWSP